MNTIQQAIQAAATQGHAAADVIAMSEAKQAVIAKMERPMPYYLTEVVYDHNPEVTHCMGFSFYKKTTAKRGSRCKFTAAEMRSKLIKDAKKNNRNATLGRTEVMWFDQESLKETASEVFPEHSSNR